MSVPLNYVIYEYSTGLVVGTALVEERFVDMVVQPGQGYVRSDEPLESDATYLVEVGRVVKV